MKKFDPLSASSKFGLCGLPIRMDTYKNCSHGCRYCFANNRVIMEFEKDLQIGDEEAFERRLRRIFDDNAVNKNKLLDVLLSQGVTIHCGGMSDPFQPSEKKFRATEKIVSIANRYNLSILFSTKGTSTYGVDIKPELHTFQLSITNVDNRVDIEPNVAPIKKRYEFYRSLKDRGFKVGIRIQPFIPGISDERIVEMFHDSDYFTIEGLKIVPQNEQHKKFIFDGLGIKKEYFTQMGLLNLKPEYREKLYEPILEELERLQIPYSIADNDMHYISSGKCCCGDALIKKSTDFNTTAMAKKYGLSWTKDELCRELDKSGCKDCVVNNLFTSNRQEGLKTVGDFMERRYERKSSPFSPKFFYSARQKPLF
jgi:hypothetical protein